MTKYRLLNVFHYQENLYFQGECYDPIHYSLYSHIGKVTSLPYPIHYSLYSHIGKVFMFLDVFSQVISLFFSYSDGGRMSMLGLGDIVRVLVFF